MRIPKRILTATLTLAVGLSSAAPTLHAQDTERSRQRASLAEEQAILRRQLRRLKESMRALISRFEEEGRVHSAEVLRKALGHLDQRDEEQGSQTLEELMDSSHGELRSGLSGKALDNQEKVIAGLEKLLVILLDREGVENIEESLEELRQLSAELDALANEEQQLREETDQLEECDDPLAPGAGIDVVHPKPELDVLPDISVREKGVILEHQAERAGLG